MFYKINKVLFSFILLLVITYSCKRNDIISTTVPQSFLLEQAKQFVKAQASQSDFQKLDWQKAVVYKEERNGTMIRIPLFGNTKAAQKAVYLNFDKGKFSGNYFEMDDNKITTLSLDNSRKCIANITDGKQVDSYTVYENGGLFQKKALACEHIL